MMNGNTETATVLNSSVPPVSDIEASAILARFFAIDGEVALLTSERDKNFRVRASDGNEYVLKIANAVEPPEVTRFQTEALLHIERMDPSLPAPRVIRTRDGGSEAVLDYGDGSRSTVRVLTFLQGEPLHKVERSAPQRRNIARCLARLDLALRDARPPVGAHELQWDIKNALKLRPQTGAIADAARRRRVEAILDGFEAHVTPVLAGLRRQVIHNDFNPHNILVAPDDHTAVSGILDFGDMVETPLVNDLAVACAYQAGPGAHPLATIAEFTAAYHEINPLTAQEIDVLFDLVKARLVTTAVLTSWRAARYPENKDYILRNNPPAWAALDQFDGLTRTAARDYLIKACEM
ncbi:MAG: phosphotransferase [Pseudomonadota bacterium]